MWFLADMSHGREDFKALTSPAFWAVVTPMRPSDPASHHRRGRAWVDSDGCDPADGAPAASLVAGRTDLEALPEGARSAFVRGGPLRREVEPAQMRTRHPVGARFSACPHRLRSRFPIRLGGDCGGGLPACPSGLLKPAGRFRESAGYWVLWDLGFLTPSSPAFWAAGTLLRPGGPASHHRRGRAWVDSDGCDPADGAPAASLVAGRTDLEALPEGARSAFVRGGPLRREVEPAQMRTRHPVGARFSGCPSSASVPVFFQVGRRLWGRASSLPVRVVEAGRAFPRECGVLGLVGSRVPDTLIPGLLGRRDAIASRRPSVAPSAWSRVG